MRSLLVRSVLALLLGFPLVLASPGDARSSSWQEIPSPLSAGFCTALEIGRQHLFAAWRTPDNTPTGLWRAPLDDPGNWVRLGLAGHPIHDVVVAGMEDELIIVAANGDTCVYLTTDGGDHWVGRDPTPIAESGQALGFNGVVPGLLYLAARTSNSVEVYRSTNLGVAWEVIQPSHLTSYKPWLVASPAGAFVYYTVYDGFWTSPVYRSSDAGESWATLQPIEWTYAIDLDLKPDDPRTVCARMGASLIQRWQGDTPLESWESLYECVGIELPAWAGGMVFAAGMDSAGQLDAAWRGWDDSAWTPMRDGLSAESGPGVMNIWVRFHLKAAPTRPALFLATHEDGLWMRDVDDLVADVSGGRAVAALPRLRLHPNPSQGAVEARWSGRLGRGARATVHDPAGRIVAAGPIERDGRFRWDGRLADGRPAPAGSYWVRVVGEAEIASERCLILR